MKKLLMFALLGFSLIHATPTIEQELEILRNCIAPQDISQRLDSFFNDQEVIQFMNMRKPIALQGHWPSKMKPSAQEGFANYQKTLRATYGQQLQSFVTYIQNKLNASVLACANNIVIALNDMPNYVIKLPVRRFPSYPTICEKISQADSFYDIERTVSPYQSVSRVFYAEKLRILIESENLTHIRMPKKYLYQLPWADRIDAFVVDGHVYSHINDNNYVVIAKRMYELDTQATLLTFKDMHDLNEKIADVKPEYEEVLIQIIQAITGAGLWTLKNETLQGINFNVFLSRENGKVIATFIDTEKPGLGGCEDRSFFHQNNKEMANNADAGLNELCDLLASK